ncbi:MULTISPECIES: trimeric intracellular cation channel family protein [unclassified Pseudoalteromonas]|uniref:trimeric intracellular cation channel family protein n=1 Tax=unclassified Pseudoalteromonas TaxID=194690 RepID=UPI0025B38E02|nr:MULTISPECIES: trimeric intracellular cation channel family protein [unclassified Pseudoalteromonas]MDN3377390.1 trimeric intracellular cation channel family protein [Pseudoalteromonas sp. APC 3893]MDN3385443.1 trimeric intracellular cation channel family protein [Pseudoalteromonas sp. APC 4017]
MTAEYFNFLSLIGVAFFAISGALLGHDKDIGGFGVVVVGTVTALGGGTLRDVLLDQPIFWIAEPNYLYATYGSIFIAVMFIRYLPDVSNYYMLLVDAVGMAIFNIVGIEKALIEGTTMIVAITMGMTTGIFGGLMRDVICREVPLVMRDELYSTTCFCGGLTYAALFLLEVNYIWCIIGSLFVTVFLRLSALHWGWQPNIFRKRTVRK